MSAHAGDECRPIASLDGLLGSCQSWTKAKPLISRSQAISGSRWVTGGRDVASLEPVSGVVPRTLVCHDMKGGYLEDRFARGSSDLAQMPYAFCHWSAIDTFVYFSHHLVTVPPVGWVSAAHTNGVKVLGTIITEWKDGEDTCARILSDPTMAESFVDRCVQLAEAVDFDGWLVNIENVIEETAVPALVRLVALLTERMHARKADSQVIWYDSVTLDGMLNWQNELNEKNSSFFDACDGIFLNYCWKEHNLETSAAIARDKKASSGLFSDRVTDVYVGVDVFGRGCLGGGGFNTGEAVAAARRHGLSVAIFAPGWTHEAANNGDFVSRERAFWRLLEPHLFLRGPLLGGGDPNAASSCIFSTTFNPGFGVQEGEVTPGSDCSSGDRWWLNMSSQEFQPSFCSCPDSWPSDVAAGCAGGCVALAPALRQAAVAVAICGIAHPDADDGQDAYLKVPIIVCQMRDQKLALSFEFVITGIQQPSDVRLVLVGSDPKTSQTLDVISFNQDFIGTTTKFKAEATSVIAIALLVKRSQVKNLLIKSMKISTLLARV